MTRAPNTLSHPTDEERRIAGEAARALRTAIADPSTMGARGVMHIDLARPRRGMWLTTWTNLPGFVRESRRYRHTSLPGWEYARHQIKSELIPDLEALAEHGLRPTEETGVAA